MRRRAVVAVFGPSQHEGVDPPQAVLDVARSLGYVITARRHVLLTGGSESDKHSVRGMAISGAGDREWVGVPRDSVEHPEQPMVIPTGFKDKRNFLEAAICDAAIALESAGRGGTQSEALCALALGRPVALVGRTWKDDWCLHGSDGPDRAKQWLKQAKEFLRASDDDIPGVESALTWRALERNLAKRRYAYFDLPGADAVEDIVTWIEGSLDKLPQRRGRFPPIEALATHKSRYQRWLDGLPRAGSRLDSASAARTRRVSRS